MTALAAAAGAAIALVIWLMRMFAGPTLYDRTLAANGVAIKAAIIVAAAGVVTERAMLIDAALGFILACATMSVAALKFFKTQTFQAPLVRSEDAS